MVAERSIVRSLPAICQFGRYELLGRIAVGGMAEIYLAREPEQVPGAGDRHLVIKRVLSHVADDPAFVEMFFDEARLAMRLHHPAIVHIYEFGEEAGSYFLAMEWVDGVALGRTIRRARAQEGMPPPIAVKIASIVADALHYAHHQADDSGRPLGVVHRDVSPQNIVISNDGAVKLLDFGIAKARDQSRRTNDGQVKGKFAYMSPQQCLGDEIDGRADVFALGVCLYEALTGRPLYHRKTQYETQRAVVEDPVPSIRRLKPDLPAELDAIVQRALAKRPDDRFETAGEMQIALERWLGSQGEVVPPPRIAQYLSQLYGDEFRGGPMVDSTPFGQSFGGGAPGLQSGRQSAPAPLASGTMLPSGGPPAVPALQPAAPPESLRPALPAGPVSDPSGARVVAASQSTANMNSSEDEELPTRGLAPLLVGLVVLLLVAGIGYFIWSTPTEEIVASAGIPAPPIAPGPSTTPGPSNAPGPSVAPPTNPAMGTPNPGVVNPTLAPADPTLPEPDLADPEVGDDNSADPLVDDPEPSRAGMERRGMRRSMRAAAEMDASMDTAEVEAPSMATAGTTGTVSINTRPWSLVYSGDRLLGTTPIGRVQLPEGPSRLRFVDRDGTEHFRTVRVTAGEDTRGFFDFRAE